MKTNLKELVRTRLASGEMTGQHSNQLNYRSVKKNELKYPFFFRTAKIRVLISCPQKFFHTFLLRPPYLSPESQVAASLYYLWP